MAGPAPRAPSGRGHANRVAEPHPNHRRGVRFDPPGLSRRRSAARERTTLPEPSATSVTSLARTVPARRSALRARRSRRTKANVLPPSVEPGGAARPRRDPCRGRARLARADDDLGACRAGLRAAHPRRPSPRRAAEALALAGSHLGLRRDRVGLGRRRDRRLVGVAGGADAVAVGVELVVDQAVAVDVVRLDVVDGRAVVETVVEAVAVVVASRRRHPCRRRRGPAGRGWRRGRSCRRRR